MDINLVQMIEKAVLNKKDREPYKNFLEQRKEINANYGIQPAFKSVNVIENAILRKQERNDAKRILEQRRLVKHTLSTMTPSNDLKYIKPIIDYPLTSFKSKEDIQKELTKENALNKYSHLKPVNDLQKLKSLNINRKEEMDIPNILRPVKATTIQNAIRNRLARKALKEAQNAVMIPTIVHKRRGRPAGRKNNKTIINQTNLLHKSKVANYSNNMVNDIFNSTLSNIKERKPRKPRANRASKSKLGLKAINTIEIDIPKTLGAIINGKLKSVNSLTKSGGIRRVKKENTIKLVGIVGNSIKVVKRGRLI